MTDPGQPPKNSEDEVDEEEYEDCLEDMVDEEYEQADSNDAAEDEEDAEEELLEAVDELLVTSPRVQRLLAIQTLIGTMHHLARMSALLYNEVREEVIAAFGREDGEHDNTEAINRRLLTILLNMTRLYHPRVLANNNVDGNSKDRPLHIFTQLLIALAHAIQHLLDVGERLVNQLSTLLDRIELAPADETAWMELQHFEAELVAFIRTIINPQLMADETEPVN